MVSFSFKKKVEVKEVVECLESEDDKPRVRQITSISNEGSVPLVPDTKPKLSVNIEELVIPCQQLVPSATHPKPITLKTQPIIIPKGASGFVFVPDANLPAKRKQPSLLMSLKATRSEGQLVDAPDQPTRGHDAEDFAWGVLRGMGYKGSTDPQPPASSDPSSKTSNRQKFGIGSNLK